MTAVPPINELILARGHELTEKLRDIEAEICKWSDELPQNRNETLDAQTHADAALVAMQQARVAIGVFVQIAAEIG